MNPPPLYSILWEERQYSIHSVSGIKIRNELQWKEANTEPIKMLQKLIVPCGPSYNLGFQSKDMQTQWNHKPTIKGCSVHHVFSKKKVHLNEHQVFFGKNKPLPRIHIGHSSKLENLKKKAVLELAILCSMKASQSDVAVGKSPMEWHLYSAKATKDKFPRR